MNFESIIHTNIPCWYEISWCQEGPALILRVHKDFAKAAPIFPQDSPLVEHFAKNLQLSYFAGDIKRDFGFDNAFSFKGENGEFIEFSVPVPVVKKNTGKECNNCKGKGTDSFLGEGRECGFCRGTGQEYFFDLRPVWAISASFYIFINLAGSPPKIDTSAPFPQLLEINVRTTKGDNGSSLSGEFSVPLCEWLGSFEERTLFPDIIEAMKTAQKKMFGEIDHPEEFRAYTSYKGHIHIDVPGDRCGVYNIADSNPDSQRGKGAELHCHNVDNPMQQIALLAGLAALHDKARDETRD